MSKKLFSIFFALLLAASGTAFGQTTAFTFQGKLTDASLPANGPYDLVFKLFDSAEGGTQIGTDIVIEDQNVAAGLFTVSLDFGQSAFSIGDPRFVQVSVRQGASTGAFTDLTPRQQITSAPYSVKSRRADLAGYSEIAGDSAALGGVPPSQYVLTTDPRMTNERQPAAGSTNYIQNQNTSPQASSNFSISGTGTADIFNAATQYNLRTGAVLRAPGSNLFVGFFTGASNTGSSNSFFGTLAGASNTSGGVNAFFGEGAGQSNTSGSINAFFGNGAGNSNITGSNNTVIGSFADVASDNLTNASAIGHRAQVSQNNSLVLGSINGVNGATASTNVGIGTTAPRSRLDVNGAVFVTGPRTTTPVGDTMSLSSESTFDAIQSFNNKPLALNPAGNNVGIGENAPETRLHVSSASNTQFMLEVTSGRKWVIGNMSGNNGNFEIRDHTGTQTSRFTITSDGNIGAGTQAPTDRLDVNGILRLRSLASGGTTSLCRHPDGQVATCGSSLRYKENLVQFGGGLDIIRRLNPITFNWKRNGALDLGLGAEEVAAVEPLLVNYNEKGEVEGVKYDRIGVVLINAVREQQEQIRSQVDEIEDLKRRLEIQRNEIAELKLLICAVSPNAGICSSPK